MRCPSCGEENPERARFCLNCGAPLVAAPPARELRKTVTVVFCDVSGSTAMGERLDPEALRRVQLRYFEAMRMALERHGATVEKYIGDAVMAVFGIPRVHEDDALRAVRAARDMRESLAALAAELERQHGVGLQVRIGVNTGEVVAGDPTAGQALVTGDAVNVAARLEQSAAPGEILLGETTHQLVRDAVVAEPVPAIRAKGKAEQVPAYRLVSVIAGAEGVARRHDVPMVGRERELRLLREAFERAIADRACVLFTILGTPGVGKSRLVEEFLTELDAEVLRGRCLSYGEGITYWPIVEMLTGAAGLSELDDPSLVGEKLRKLAGDDHQAGLVAERLTQLFGEMGVPAAAEETFWAVRTLFEAVARARPLVVDLDDLQWAEPTLLDLVEHVTDWIREAPVLLLCSARPELLDARPTWGGGKRNAASIELEPLSAGETERLVGELVAEVPDRVADRISAVAEGNPLFVEHLVAMLVEDGTLVPEDGGWTVAGDLASLEVPPTVSALIEARVELLGPEELVALEHAAVEGKAFHRGAVVALAAEVEPSDVSARLTALVRRDLIRPSGSLFPGEDGFAFRHLLIRDVAYARIPKDVRADLHVRYADWLDAAAGDREGEFDEIAGYHLQLASRLWDELRPGDPRARRAGERAAERLGSAGRRAFARGDLRAAGTLLSRAHALLLPSAIERAEILLDLAVIREREGRYEDALAELDALERLAEETGDRAIAARTVVRRQFVRSHVGETPQAELQAEVEAFLPELEAAGDEIALAEVSHFLGVSSSWLGREQRAFDMLERARELAIRAGEVRLALEAASWIPAVVSSGPFTATSAHERWEGLTASLPMSRYARAVGDTMDACSLAMSGRFAEARARWGESQALLAELGDEINAAGTSMMGAQVELTAGDFEAARRMLVEGDRTLERLGETGYRSTVLCRLADALQALGRPQDAMAATERAEGISFVDDFETNAGWRSAQARTLADVGAFEDAERLALEALDVLADTDALDAWSRSRSSLGYVLASAGRTQEALDAYRRALDVYERKGSVPSVSRVRRTMVILRGEDPGPAEFPPGAWGTTWPRGG